MLIIFDLDGTLIDSAQDLATAMNATREYAGLSPLEPSVIYSYVGNGAATLVRRALGAETSDELADRCLQFFLVFYRKHSLQHTRLYPGIEAMVRNLHTAGHTLAVLTNKPRKISFDILQGLHVGSFFSKIYGGDSFEAKKPDPVGIDTLRQELAHAPSETWMVGDSSVDIMTARNAGVQSCGVLWGFQPESLHACGPDALIDSPEDLLSSIAKTGT